MSQEFVYSISAAAWVFANILVMYSGIALLVFVLGYYILFDPGATTAGKFVWRFAFSLVGVMALIFVGLFIDPTPGREWYLFPGDVLWWRPFLRLGIMSYVAFTITGLAVLLGIRKWRPELIKTARDLNLVQPRSDTREVPIIKHEGETDGKS